MPKQTIDVCKNSKILRPTCVLCFQCGIAFIKSGIEIKRSLKRNKGLVDYCSSKCQRIGSIQQAHKRATQRANNRLWKRFWAKVDKTPGQGPNGDCWEWIGDRNLGGYGILGFLGITYLSHRIIYLLEYGEFLTDLFVCHKCDNRGCVRPSHLFLGTLQDNVRDMVNKKRQAKGNMCGAAKVTEEIINEIKSLYNQGKSSKILAKQFNLTSGHIRRIIKGERWRHLNAGI